MLKFGFGARQFGGYKISFQEEVDFAKQGGFDFIQVWYDAKSGLEINQSDNKEKTIKESNFPTIIHSVLDVVEIKEHVEKLIPILKFLGHNELIIHPHSKVINENEALRELIKSIKFCIKKLSKENITLYTENNSKLNPIFSSTEEIKYVFDQISELEFLLDVAHIDNLKHLEEMVAIKYPKILHVADRHLEVIHEHLPIGDGNIDYEYIFKHALKNYEGRIVFEITQSTEALIKSKAKIYQMLAHNI